MTRNAQRANTIIRDDALAHGLDVTEARNEGRVWLTEDAWIILDPEDGPQLCDGGVRRPVYPGETIASIIAGGLS